MMKNKRLMSLGLTAVLIVSVCGCGKRTETAGEAVTEHTEETAGAEEIAKRAVDRTSKSDVEKEETVYVNADANGNVKNITVSSWLKNGTGADELTDVTTLTDVVNVKGDETFTQDGETYVWAAEGNDIYYQGETTRDLPVNVKVTYYLDDQKIEPGELAGKSGRVKIRFDYENLTAQQAEIGGEAANLCVPFVAASTMVLDSDKFVNIEVENGKIISDGKNTIVAGVAMPGLYESLDLLNLEGFEDVDIPEYVEVTADVTDFELGMTATVLMPDILSELNTDDMDGFDDLKDDIEELNDATYDLIDGCVELDDGVQELKDNMPDLWDGAVELDDGAQELDDGAWELDGGAQDLLDGAGDLADGARTIREGAKELDQGMGSLQAGAGLLNDNMPNLTGGVNQLAGGLQALQTPMMLGPDGKSGDAEHPYIKTSVGLLKHGVDQLAAGVSGMGTTLQQSIAENQKKMQAAGQQVAQLEAQLKQAKSEAEGTRSRMNTLAEEMGMVLPENAAGQKMGTDEVSVSTEGNATDAQDDKGSAATEETDMIPEAQEDSSTAPESQKDPSAVSENEKNSTAVSEDVKTSTEVPEGQKESTVPSENTEKAPAVSENQNEALNASNSIKESSAEPEHPKEEMTSEPDSTGENASASAPEKTAEEASANMPEASEPEQEASETQELSEFGKAYLEGLSQSEGMTSMSMVLTADQGADASDPAAEVERYKTIVEGYQQLTNLQTDLALKQEEINELQEQLYNATVQYAALQGATEALTQVARQLSAGADPAQLAQLTEGMAALEDSVGQIYDGVNQINSRMEALTGGAADLQKGVGDLKTGADALKVGTSKLYQGGIDLRKGSRKLYKGTEELKDGTEELKDGTKELKDGTQELKDGVVDLVDGVDELKDGTEELLDGVHEYNDDGIQKLYDTVNGDLQNLLDRVDAIADLSGGYQSFSGKSDGMEGSVKFIIETEAIEVEEEE